ncbi:hypothetical protein HDK77DRAFT_291155 [Phyllosticta capitalensis]
MEPNSDDESSLSSLDLLDLDGYSTPQSLRQQVNEEQSIYKLSPSGSKDHGSDDPSLRLVSQIMEPPGHILDRQEQIGQGSSNNKKLRPEGLACFECGTTEPGQRRKGPRGPNTLCNRCGMRWLKGKKADFSNGESSCSKTHSTDTRASNRDPNRREEIGHSSCNNKRDETRTTKLPKMPKNRHPDGSACLECGVRESISWRAGPTGPKTLCNACACRLWGMKKKEKRIREEEDLNSSAAPTSREAHGPSSLRPNTLSRPPGKQHLSATQGLRTADSKDDSRTMKKHKGSGEIACADCGKCNPKRWRKGPNGPKTYCDACGHRRVRKKKKEEERQRQNATGAGSHLSGSGSEDDVSVRLSRNNTQPRLTRKSTPDRKNNHPPTRPRAARKSAPSHHPRMLPRRSPTPPGHPDQDSRANDRDSTTASSGGDSVRSFAISNNMMSLPKNHSPSAGNAPGAAQDSQMADTFVQESTDVEIHGTKRSRQDFPDEGLDKEEWLRGMALGALQSQKEQAHQLLAPQQPTRTSPLRVTPRHQALLETPQLDRSLEPRIAGIARIFEDFLLRGNVRFLDATASYYLSAAIISLRAAATVSRLSAAANRHIDVLSRAVDELARASNMAQQIRDQGYFAHCNDQTLESLELGPLSEADREFFPFVGPETSPLVALLLDNEAETRCSGSEQLEHPENTAPMVRRLMRGEPIP